MVAASVALVSGRIVSSRGASPATWAARVATNESRAKGGFAASSSKATQPRL